MCMDANENIYKDHIGKALTDEDGLGMIEVVGNHTGEKNMELHSSEGPNP